MSLYDVDGIDGPWERRMKRETRLSRRAAVIDAARRVFDVGHEPTEHCARGSCWRCPAFRRLGVALEALLEDAQALRLRELSAKGKR